MERLLRYHVARILAIVTSGFVLFNVFQPLDPLAARSTFFLFIFVVMFLRGSPNPPRSLALDVVLAGVSVVVFGYVAVYWEDITFRVGTVTPLDTILGFATILLVLEATRRYVGWVLTGLVIFFILYGFFGQYLPRDLGGHGGFSVGRLVTYMYLSQNGIFGIVIYTLFRYVFLFVMFGKVLQCTGALDFIMDFASALLGRVRGGPAMVAVTSSAMVGMVSGSAVGNVMVTGTITIPLMKKIGFKPEVAAGIEAAASTGGQIMPPVMGAAAFLIMQFLGISYFEVMKAVFIPACLYYIGLLIAVAVYARRANVPKISAGDMPGLGKVMRDPKGLIFFTGFAVLVILLVIRDSPIMPAIYAMAVIALMSLSINGISHFLLGGAPAGEGLKRLYANGIEVFEKSADDFRMLGAAGAAVGLIAAMIMLTGLAGRFSNLVIGIAGEHYIFPVFLMTMIACIILGMGLPTTVCYIVLVLVVVPTLTKIGVLPLAAHLFIFFYGIMSMVTPPVCLASFAAATIAKTDFWKAGVQGFLLAMPAYILPYAFVLNPDYPLLMRGPPLSILVSTVTALVGVAFLVLSLIGPVRTRREIPSRVLFFPAAVMLIMPNRWMEVVGLGLAAIGLLIPWVLKSASRGTLSDSSKA